MVKLFAIIPGFGAPHVETKLSILKRNLDVLQRYAWSHLQIRICVYDDTELPAWVTHHPCVQVVREPGIVGDFLIRHATPDDVDAYDYVFMLLDDILLSTDFPWHHIIVWKRDFGFNIMSPTLTSDSKYVYRYMLQDSESACTLRSVRVCEFFCYFMDASSYKRYYQHLDTNNPWMWGLDLIIDKHMNLSVGLMNWVTMKHFFHGDSYAMHPDKSPCDGYNHVLKKYGEKDDIELRNQQHTKYIIHDVSVMRSLPF